jgi:hypothetical protein
VTRGPWAGAGPNQPLLLHFDTTQNEVAMNLLQIARCATALSALLALA